MTTGTHAGATVAPATVTPAATASTTTSIPFRRDDETASSALAGGGIGVLVVSLVAIAAVLFLRRRLKLHGGQAAAGRALRVVESARLGPRGMLSVVEFDGTLYLVAQGEHGISCLAEKPAVPPGDTQ